MEAAVVGGNVKRQNIVMLAKLSILFVLGLCIVPVCKI